MKRFILSLPLIATLLVALVMTGCESSCCWITGIAAPPEGPTGIPRSCAKHERGILSLGAWFWRPFAPTRNGNTDYNRQLSKRGR